MIDVEEFRISCLDQMLLDDSNQGILALLKKRGAPIKGTFFLEVDENYSVEFMMDPLTGDYIYSFIKKDRQKDRPK